MITFIQYNLAEWYSFHSHTGHQRNINVKKIKVLDTNVCGFYYNFFQKSITDIIQLTYSVLDFIRHRPIVSSAITAYHFLLNHENQI